MRKGIAGQIFILMKSFIYHNCDNCDNNYLNDDKKLV